MNCEVSEMNSKLVKFSYPTKVMTTTNYDIFKVLEYNRDVKQSRVFKIMSSIENIGYVPIPIICNERMAVIDGQGRLAACKRLGIPVPYIVIEGLGLKECIQLNNIVAKWKTGEFIKSYAGYGDVNYQYLDALVKQFPDYSIITITFATKLQQAKSSDLLMGRFVCDEEMYNVAVRRLTRCLPLIAYSKMCSGRSALLLHAFIFASDHEGVNFERLLKNAPKFCNENLLITNLNSALEATEKICNYQSKNKVYLKADYDKAISTNRDAGGHYGSHRERKSISDKTKKAAAIAALNSLYGNIGMEAER